MDSAHIFLTSGADYFDAKGKVEHFLKENLLVRYTSLVFDDDEACDNLNEQFWQTLTWAVEQNKLTLQGLLAEISDLGYDALSDLTHLPQGYESKLLHTVTHLLDGFFGLDSFFYNLSEDSNWVRPGFLEKIQQCSDAVYYLVHVQGRFTSPEEADQVHNMRRIGVSSL